MSGSRHILVVYSNAAEGQDEEYNRWYTETHLPEVVETDGFVAAQRFRLSPLEPPQEEPYGYLAIYEVEGDVEAARAALDRGRSARVPVPDAMSPNRRSAWYTAITERLATKE
jgi:hypothetical protein